MEHYNEVNNQLLFFGRLSSLKSIYSDVKEKQFFQIIADVQLFHVIFTLVDTVYYSLKFFNKQDLIKLVVNAMEVCYMAAGIVMHLVMRFGIKDFVEKTKELREVHHSHTPCMKEIQHKNFTIGYKNSHFLNNLIGIMALFAEVSFLTFGTGFSYLATKSSYPLPFFREIFFCPVTGPLSYAVNMMALGWACGTTIIYFSVNTTFLFYASSLAIAELNVTIEAAKKIDSTISAEVSYDEWVKIVMDSISTSKGILVFLREKYSIPCYLMHKCSYISLFVSFVIFKIDPRQMGTASAGLSTVIALLIWVLLNEHFQDKFSELNEAIYNLNWKDMKPKDRKMLIFLISSSQRPISLTAGGIDDLSLKWFGGMLQAGYSAALILEDLLIT